MATIEQHRWVTTDADFAVRVDVQDVPGFFSRKLTIDPGVRAIFLEKGQSVGEVPQGQYTLETLFERLKFWTKTSTTVILTRAEEIPLELDCTGILTKEFLELEVSVRLTVQLEDVALFLKNMLGPRNGMTREELKAAIFPVVRQALWETIGRLSIQELTGQQARGDIELCIRQALQTSLTRNGLKFVQVQTLTVAHPEYDDQRRKTGQLWLQRNDLQFQEQEAKLTADRLFAETQQREHLDEIEILAKQVASDRMEQELGVKLRRVGLRKEWRAAIQAETFDKVNSEEELRRFLQERDKSRLIDEDEYAALAATLRDMQSDREARRAHLLQKLDIEQACELRGVRAELDHAFKVQTLQHEIALAQAIDDESSRRWQQELKKEREAAEQRRTQELQELEHARTKVRATNATNREEALAQILHTRELDAARGDIQLAQTERQSRIALFELDLQQQREERRLALRQREAEITRQIEAEESQNQFQRFERLTRLKIERQKADSELRVAESQAREQLEILKKGQDQQHELDRIDRLRGAGEAELMVLTGNASLYADIQKTKVEQESIVGVAQAQAAGAVASNADVKALQEKRDTDHANTLNLMMQLLQQNQQAGLHSQQLLADTAHNLSRNLAPQPQAPPTVLGVGVGGVLPAAGGPASPTAGVVICAGCRTENLRENRFCSQCGKPL